MKKIRNYFVPHNETLFHWLFKNIMNPILVSVKSFFVKLIKYN